MRILILISVVGIVSTRRCGGCVGCRCCGCEWGQSAAECGGLCGVEEVQGSGEIFEEVGVTGGVEVQVGAGGVAALRYGV